MNVRFKIIIIFSCMVLYLNGCGVQGRTGSRPYRSFPKKINNHYYYFVEAQLQLGKGDRETALGYLTKAAASDPESIYLKKELAIMHIQMNNNENALAATKEILSIDPDNVEALILLGRINQRLERIDDAISAYEGVIAADPKQEGMYLLLGNLLTQNSKFDQAADVYMRMIDRFPDAYAGYFFLGQIYARDNPVEAEKYFLKTLELKPGLLEPRYELINLYSKPKDNKKNREKIIGLYRQILDNYPGDIRAMFELGYYYHKNGKKKKAEKIFKDLGAKSLTDQTVIINFLKLYLDNKQYAAAAIVLEGMLKGAPECSDIHYLMGLTWYEYEGKEDYGKAEKHFKKVAPESRFYDNSVIHIAFILQKQERFEDAVEFLADVVQKKPDNMEFMLYLGSMYEELNQFSKAEEVFNKGLIINDVDTNLRFRLGVIYDKMGRKEESLKQMREVIKIDPKDANALNYLGYTMAEAGTNLDEAEKLIKEALKYMPDDGYITDSLGWVYYKKGLFKEAADLLEKAIMIVPNDPIILEHLGDTYLKLDEKKKALEYYKRSLEHQGDDDPEKKALIQEKINQLTDNSL